MVAATGALDRASLHRGPGAAKRLKQRLDAAGPHEAEVAAAGARDLRPEGEPRILPLCWSVQVDLLVPADDRQAARRACAGSCVGMATWSIPAMPMHASFAQEYGAGGAEPILVLSLAGLPPTITSTGRCPMLR